MLGEFEYVLITVAAGLGERAYGVAIREEIEATTERRCSVGALYTTIDRLERKGLLKTWMGEATSQRGGRANFPFYRTTGLFVVFSQGKPLLAIFFSPQ